MSGLYTARDGGIEGRLHTPMNGILLVPREVEVPVPGPVREHDSGFGERQLFNRNSLNTSKIEICPALALLHWIISAISPGRRDTKAEFPYDICQSAIMLSVFECCLFPFQSRYKHGYFVYIVFVISTILG
jgi:hypothetical protein